jgi:predicted MPP superfamily phosphohydrolase
VGIVSAGLGTHSINIRLLNQPELVIIDLLPEEVD